ncbi:hypothetical protein ONK27_26350, partial [Salmonella enterica subsp. enterica serovar Virginia]|nr:hypothetical protein [Salmonella enterica subsp. enterica serovar Virginia]
SMLPSISPELARIAPGFRALSINVIAAPVRDAQVGEIALKEALREMDKPDFDKLYISAYKIDKNNDSKVLNIGPDFLYKQRSILE